jgi:5'-nucleotidase
MAELAKREGSRMSGRRRAGSRSARLVFALFIPALSCAHARAPEAVAAPAGPPAQVRLLTLNDFHGQLVRGKTVGGRPVGSAGVLGAWLVSARAGAPGRTLLVHAGDLVGASPPASALLQDEPTISFVNRFAGPACRSAGSDAPPAPPGIPRPEVEERFQAWLDPACDVVGTVGNHEFDEGQAELLRLLAGGDHPRGPFLEKHWRGARYPTLAANVVDHATGRPILPPFVVKRVDGVLVGFVGVVLHGARGMVDGAGVAGLDFQDEAEAIDRYVAILKKAGVHAIVVLAHQGGEQPPYRGPTHEGTTVEGAIVDLVAKLDPEVDVVVAGHTHQFLNAWLPARDGKRVLVVEAFSAGTAFGWVDLEVDRASDDVVGARAAVQTAWADEGPGRTPDPASANLQADAEAKVAGVTSRVICTAAVPFGRATDAAGESRLGDLVTDAQRTAAPGVQIAFTNRGGMRTDLKAGVVTWGDLFAAQPFGNELVAMTLTGEQLLALLEQQWAGGRDAVLPVSGLTYAWSASEQAGGKVRDVRVGGAPLDRTGRYRVVVNGYLASGGDGLTVLLKGTDRASAGNDLDVLAAYLHALPQPVNAPEGGRIRALP